MCPFDRMGDTAREKGSPPPRREIGNGTLGVSGRSTPGESSPPTAPRAPGPSMPGFVVAALPPTPAWNGFAGYVFVFVLKPRDWSVAGYSADTRWPLTHRGP